MREMPIVYHSAHGHTGYIAHQIHAKATSMKHIHADLLNAKELALAPNALIPYDGVVLVSPTYLGGVSAPFKTFMDATGNMWRQQSLKGKLAAGFTVSSLPAGENQSTLLSMFILCMQHGMLCKGYPILPEQHNGVSYDEAVTRLGSWSGLIPQASHSMPADSCTPGDVKTAQLCGSNFAQCLLRISPSDVELDEQKPGKEALR